MSKFNNVGSVSNIQGAFDAIATTDSVELTTSTTNPAFTIKSHLNTAANLEILNKAGTQRFSVTGNGLITAASRIVSDDTTNATTTLDGSIQTDGGLSVAKDIFTAGNVNLASSTANTMVVLNDSAATATNYTGVLYERNSTGKFYVGLDSNDDDLKITRGDHLGTDVVVIDSVTGVSTIQDALITGNTTCNGSFIHNANLTAGVATFIECQDSGNSNNVMFRVQDLGTAAAIKPTLSAYGGGSADACLQINSLTETGDDSGSTPVFIHKVGTVAANGNDTTTAVINTRPLYQFKNHTTEIYNIAATGLLTYNKKLTVIDTLKASAALDVTGASTLTGAVTASSTLTVTGTSTLNGAVNVANDLTITGTTNQFIPPSVTTTQKNALTATEGNILYDSTLNEHHTYINSAWQRLYANIDYCVMSNTTSQSISASTYTLLALNSIDKEGRSMGNTTSDDITIVTAGVYLIWWKIYWQADNMTSTPSQLRSGYGINTSGSWTDMNMISSNDAQIQIQSGHRIVELAASDKITGVVFNADSGGGTIGATNSGDLYKNYLGVTLIS